MADLHPPHPTSIHPGVDARTWQGFEERIQSKRFHALVASARAAIADRNLALAEHALQEAREIRPHADQIEVLAAEIRRLAPSNTRSVFRRTGAGLALLGVGVFMVLALDEIRLAPQAILGLAPPAPRMLNAVSTARALTTLPEAPPSEAPSPAAASPASPLPPPPPQPAAPRVRPALPAVGEVAPLVATDVEDSQERQDIMEPTADAVPQGDSVSFDLPSTMPRHVVPALLVSSAPAAVVPAVHVDRSAEEQSRVAEVLRRYATAFGTLDVRAARDVWPSVDQRALARAFDSLTSQSVSFDSCEIRVSGTIANASCHGRASYVGKVGRGTPRVEPRTWRFELRSDGESWTIANAEARRTAG